MELPIKPIEKTFDQTELERQDQIVATYGSFALQLYLAGYFPEHLLTKPATITTISLGELSYETNNNVEKSDGTE